MSHDVNRRRTAYWDKQAARYDRAMNFWDRHLFGDSRPWACGRAAFSVNRPDYRPEAAVDGWEKILAWFGAT